MTMTKKRNCDNVTSAVASITQFQQQRTHFQHQCRAQKSAGIKSSHSWNENQEKVQLQLFFRNKIQKIIPQTCVRRIYFFNVKYITTVECPSANAGWWPVRYIDLEL